MKRFTVAAAAVFTTVLAVPAFAEMPLPGTESTPPVKPWTNESEIGVIVSKGNTDVQTYSGKTVTSYKWSKNQVSILGTFLNSFADQVQQAKAWNLGIKYERTVSERAILFVAQSIDGDRFQNIRQRYNSDAGLKYDFIRRDKFYWFSEGGYRFTRENRTTELLSLHKLRAYTEVEKTFGTGTSAKAGVEVLPNLTRGRDWQVNATTSISAIMNSVFSVKTAYVLRYDHETAPGVAYKTDHTVTSALVAKF